MGTLFFTLKLELFFSAIWFLELLEFPDFQFSQLNSVLNWVCLFLDMLGSLMKHSSGVGD